MRRLLETVSRVAPRDITVLVRGATGTGKELVAALLHAESRRAQAPLVRFNCAAIPGELAEAEDRKSTRLNSSHLVISYAVFCLKKKKQQKLSMIQAAALSYMT